MQKLIIYLEKDRVRTLLIVLFLFFAFIISPIILTLSDQYTSVLFSPDISLFYSPSTFYETLLATGQSGRNYYLITTWTFDLIYPLVYGLSILSMLIHYNINEKYPIYIFPLIAILFDYLENTLASLLAIFYRKEINILVYVLQAFTLIKWISIGISIIIMVYLIIKNLKKI